MTNRMRVARGRGLIAMSVATLAALAVILPASGRGAPPFFDSGDIIVADSWNDAIKAVDPVTGTATPISNGGDFVFPADVAFADDGDILVVDRDAFENKGGIIRVDSVTAIQTTVSSNAISEAAGGKRLFSNPIALDRKQDSLFVTDFHKDKVIKVDATGKQSLVSKGGDLNASFGIVAAGLAKPLVSHAGAYGRGESSRSIRTLASRPK
jgi:sugar lactone lactonase YvrE